MTKKRSDPADLAFQQLCDLGCTGMRLQAVTRLAMQIYSEFLADTGLSSAQFATLAYLSRDGSQSIGHLAELLDTDQTTLTRNLRLMEQRKLIAQSVSATDRRRKVIRLTPEGHRLFRKALPLWQKAQAELARRLGHAQTAQLNRQLDLAMPRLRT
jgi:DNA-binding MarR family transcriptional regulator